MAGASVAAKHRVGDRVAFDFGRRRVKGVIVEDRGPLGTGGRQIFRVRLDMDPYEPMYFELEEDELAPVTAPDAPLSREEIVDYFLNGGLMLILRTSAGGQQTPRVWLRRDNLENVTHTFNPEFGLAGGEPAPVWTRNGQRMFRPRRADVVRFVKSFGLSENEASRVVDRIGGFPS